MNHKRNWLCVFAGVAVFAVAANACAPISSGSGGLVATSYPAATQASAATAALPLASPTAQGQPEATIGFQNAVQFSESECACSGLTVSSAMPWGESLECRYDWSGPNIDDNKLGFVIARINHPDDWDDQFIKDQEDILNEYQYSSDPNAAVNEFVTGADAYGVLVTQAGYSRNDQPIERCGAGKLEMSYGNNWMVIVDLRSCEAPNDMSGYIDQLTTVQECALNLIDTKE